MTPGDLPLSLYRGDTYRWQFVLWADAEKTTPADLTGVVVRSEFRADYNGPVVYTLPCTVTLPNLIDAEVTAAASLVLPPTAVWDLQLTYPDGFVSTILAGVVTVRKDVTAAVPPVVAVAS